MGNSISKKNGEAPRASPKYATARRSGGVSRQGSDYHVIAPRDDTYYDWYTRNNHYTQNGEAPRASPKYDTARLSGGVSRQGSDYGVIAPRDDSRNNHYTEPRLHGARIESHRTSRDQPMMYNGSAHDNYRSTSCHIDGKDDKVEVSCMDMPVDQFQQVSDVVIRCLDRCRRRRSSEGGVSKTEMAQTIKSALDAELGPAWSVVMGDAFGMFVTYEQSQFAHFYVGPNEFVVYKAFGAEEANRPPSTSPGYSTVDANRPSTSSGYFGRDTGYNTDGSKSTFLTPTGSRASPKKTVSSSRYSYPN